MRLRTLAVLAVSIFIGYGTEWSAHYVGVFHPTELNVLGQITKFETSCRSESGTNAICKHGYSVPSAALEPFVENGSFGAGQLLSAVTYSCIEAANLSQITFDDPKNPGRIYDLMNRYQTIPLKNLGCKEGVFIETWSGPKSRRTGHVGGTAVVGTTEAVDRVKRLVEFFTVDILILFGFLFLALSLLASMLRRILSTTVHTNPFEQGVWLWMGYIFFCSGLAQILLPITAYPQFNNRIVSTLSLICHADVLIRVIRGFLQSRYKSGASFKVISSLPALFCVLSAVSMCTPWFASIFPVVFIACASGTIIFGIIAKADYLLAFGLAYLLTGLKVVGVPNLPHAQITTFFVGIISSLDVVSRFRQGAKLTRLIRWSVDRVELGSAKSDLIELSEEAIRMMDVGQLTVLSMQVGGGCTITVLKREADVVKTEIYHREELPPIFAHVVSTGQPAWHLHEESAIMVNIRRGQNASRNYEGKYLCAFPLFGDEFPVGAFAFTNYEDSWINDVVKRHELETMVKLVTPLFVEIVTATEIKKTGKWADVSNRVHRSIAHIKSSMSEVVAGDSSNKALFQDLIESICNNFGSYGYIASLDPTSRKYEILGIDGYPKEVHERLTTGKLFALKENEQGPLAIAANRQRTVVVSDVNLWKGVLHENTNSFFERCGTRSCVAVPIFGSNLDSFGRELEKYVWGVLFLERNTPDPFTLDLTHHLNDLANKITELLRSIDDRKILGKTQRALSTFVPDMHLEKVIDQNVVREEDQGILVMVDIKDSTRISLERGSREWTSNVQKLARQFEELAASHGFRLHLIVWDAFYFTLTRETLSGSDLARTIDFLSEASGLIEGWYNQNYSELGFRQPVLDAKARYCITFGDTSRGFSEGTTRTWTLVGNEMAAISKLEDACKKLDGVVFSDESTHSATLFGQWSNSSRKVPGTSREIYVLDATWEELLDMHVTVIRKIG